MRSGWFNLIGEGSSAARDWWIPDRKARSGGSVSEQALAQWITANMQKI